VASELLDNPGRLRAAAAVMLTLPGTPFLYYGEEGSETAQRGPESGG